jgi:hypothetical protein
VALNATDSMAGRREQDLFKVFKGDYQALITPAIKNRKENSENGLSF